MKDIIVVGAGPVGLFAGFYAGMRGLDGEIIESLNYYGGQLTTLYPQKPIYDVPGFKEIKATELIDKLYDQYTQFKDVVPLTLGCKLEEIHKIEGGFEIKTSKKTIETKSILFVSGNGDFKPRKLDIVGANLFKNITYGVANLDIYKNKNVLILGGGDSALDWANMIKDVGANVKIVHRRNEFRAHEESIAKFKENGEIITPYVAKELIGVGDQVSKVIIEHVDTKERRELDVDYIIVNFGFLPTSFAYAPLGIQEIDRAIIVNPDMSSSLPGVFGAGNCVNYPGKVKTIGAGMGEAITAINSINFYLNPAKNVGPIYSSLLMHKKV